MENCFALWFNPQVFFEADFRISALITLVTFSFFKEALSVNTASISDSESQYKMIIPISLSFNATQKCCDPLWMKNKILNIEYGKIHQTIQRDFQVLWSSLHKDNPGPTVLCGPLRDELLTRMHSKIKMAKGVACCHYLILGFRIWNRRCVNW